MKVFHRGNNKPQDQSQPKIMKVFRRGNTKPETNNQYLSDSIERENECSICGKKNCCADDHRFHGLLIGMGF